MDILFNQETGTPLMMTCQTAYMESVGKPAGYDKKKRDLLSPYGIDVVKKIPYGNLQVMEWGSDNAFPQKAAEVIRTTSVLNTGLKFLRTLTVGQGIYPCHVTGYDAKGNEVLEGVSDAKVDEVIRSVMVRRYLERASRDYFKYGNAAVQLMLSRTDKRIEGLNVLNALYYRYTLPDSWGAHKCVVSGCWPSLPGTQAADKPRTLDVLMDYDQRLHYDWLKVAGKLPDSVVYAVRDSWSNDDYYSEPIWLSSYILGWVDIAHMVPSFLKKAYKNQITWKWHVQIPYSYWDKKFPLEEYQTKGIEQRKQDIQRWMNQVEENLCGVENAEKPLFTNYAVNEANGKMEEEWKISALDNKYKGGENLVTSAAANSEILFSLMVNPNVFGAGMPGGTYAGNQGGSNIREAFLVNIANAWIDRQNLLDPIRLLLHSRGIDDVELRFRNTILTTLDSGAGTARTLS